MLCNEKPKPELHTDPNESALCDEKGLKTLHEVISDRDEAVAFNYIQRQDNKELPEPEKSEEDSEYVYLHPNPSKPEQTSALQKEWTLVRDKCSPPTLPPVQDVYLQSSPCKPEQTSSLPKEQTMGEFISRGQTVSWSGCHLRRHCPGSR